MEKEKGNGKETKLTSGENAIQIANRVIGTLNIPVSYLKDTTIMVDGITPSDKEADFIWYEMAHNGTDWEMMRVIETRCYSRPKEEMPDRTYLKLAGPAIAWLMEHRGR